MVFPGQQESTWTYDEEAGAWYFHRFYKHQPDLNVTNTRVRDEIAKIMIRCAGGSCAPLHAWGQVRTSPAEPSRREQSVAVRLREGHVAHDLLARDENPIASRQLDLRLAPFGYRWFREAADE